MLFSAGCTTKNYVRQQTQPVIDKSNDLDAITAKNTNAIRDVDARSQQGIQSASEKATQADQKALDARARADQAQTIASQAATRVDQLSTQVANLDNYHAVVETSVHFAFDRADLTQPARAALDQLVDEIGKTKGYIVVIEGGTDSVGSAAYNYKLSERRADAVVQYLASKNVPAHKIYIIGLGKDKTVAPNTDAEGRAKNRRVDIRLMTNNPISENQASAQSAAPNSSR